MAKKDKKDKGNKGFNSPKGPKFQQFEGVTQQVKADKNARQDIVEDSENSSKHNSTEETKASFENENKKEKKASTKSKCGFVEGLMGKFGYVQKDATSLYMININKLIDKEMDEKLFAQKSLVEQFNVIAKRINALMNSYQTTEDDVSVKNVVAVNSINEHTAIAETVNTDCVVKDEAENAEVDVIPARKKEKVAAATLEKLRNENNELYETLGKYKDTIAEKENAITELTIAKNDAEIALESVKAQIDAELKDAKEKLVEANKEIKIKEGELTAKIIQLNTTNDELHGQISVLNNRIAGLEQDKVNLTSAKDAAERLTREKINFIYGERDTFAKSMITLAESLSATSSKDFLGCCDEAFESNRVSLQEKVSKPIRAFVRELAEIDPRDYASQKALEETYHAVVKENLNSTSGLTRIAQWYAYSCVPFMVDEDRSDGLFVRYDEIKNMYSLATKLLGMVGVEYRLPILFVERMPEDNTYDDVTGQRQLNIEYMCPTARSHKEHIDCINNSSVIIDVVEVGYRDNRGNNKNPQVII